MYHEREREREREASWHPMSEGGGVNVLCAVELKTEMRTKMGRTWILKVGG